MKNILALNDLLTDDQLEKGKPLLKQERQEILETKAVIIRHGYSQGNAGEASMTPESISLAETGQKQAFFLATFLPERNWRIIHSRYIRTRLTALPAISRFASAEISELPIQEFTYLDPSKYRGTTVADRLGAKNEYWRRMDPEYRDGGEAESFVDVWKRAEELRNFIDKTVPGVLIFTHGQFMRLLKLQAGLEFESPAIEAMEKFYSMEKTLPVPNTGRITAKSGLELSEIKVNHLPKDLITF